MRRAVGLLEHVAARARRAGRPSPMTRGSGRPAAAGGAAMPLRSCVVSTIATPCALRSSSRWSISWRSCTSTPEVGSSSSSRSGRREQGAGDEHALLLAARELADVAVGQLVDARAARAPRRPRRARRALAHGSSRRCVRAMSTHSRDGHREAPVDRLDLRHVADAQPRRAGRPCPALGAACRVISAQQRRLARARRPDDADELARADARGRRRRAPGRAP